MTEHFISLDEAGCDLLASATYLAERVGGGDDRAEAISAVVPQYLAKQNVDLAAELANSVDDPFVRDRLLIIVAEKCAEIGDDEYALQLVDAIEEFGLQAQARERIAAQFAAKGDVEKAREIAAEMSHPDGVFAVIAVNQALRGEMDAAIETITEISFPRAAVSAFMSIAAGLTERKDAGKAIEMLDKASTVSADIEHQEEKIRAYVEIGNLYLDAGRNGLAIKAFERARLHTEELENVHRDAFFVASASGFLRAGSIDLADRALDEVADKTQIASCLLGFAREFWEKDQREEALDALDEAYLILKSQRERETRDSMARFALFGSIAAQFAGFEKGERAIEIAESIEEEGQMMSALSHIAQILTIKKSVKLARQALQAIQEDANRMFALVGMSDAAKNNDEKAEAVSMLAEAAELAETVPQLSARSSAYNEIAKRLVVLGETESARKTVSVNLQAIALIRGDGSRSVALANLAGLFEMAGFKIAEQDNDIIRSLLVQR